MTHKNSCAKFKEDSQWKLKTLKSMDLMCGIVLVLREQIIRDLLLLGKPILDGGELSVYMTKDGNLLIDTECMGKDFAKQVLCQLVDEAEEM